MVFAFCDGAYKKSRSRVGRAFLCAAVAVVGAGCGHDHTTAEAGPPPTVSMQVSPSSVTQGESVAVTIEVENFELVPDAYAQAKHAGHGDGEQGVGVATQGHYHVYLNSLDGNPLLMGHEAVSELTVDAPPGDHTLIVRLHDTTHRIIEPQITDEAALTILPTTGAGGAGGGGGTGGAATGGGGSGGAPVGG